jgi:predicted RND superfamily exporter protein
VEAAERAAAQAGPAIWVNAIMIAAGFAVLTLGEARPLQNVGTLTAASMFTAAATTFLAIPALARRRRYRAPGAQSTVVMATELDGEVNPVREEPRE